MRKFLFAFSLLLMTGCASARPEKWTAIDANQEVNLRTHPVFEFEGETWRVQDKTAHLTDSELREAGQANGLVFLAERFDIPPYEKLYFKIERYTFWVAAKEKS